MVRKYRRKVLTPEIEATLQEVLKQIGMENSVSEAQRKAVARRTVEWFLFR